MTILADILQQKKKEVAQLQAQTSPFAKGTKKVIPSIKQTFSASNHMNVIAEIKRASPSKGAIDLQVDPVEQAKQYEAYGAGGISVLTDNTFFKGSMDDLIAVREAVNIPLLCKDFIVDPIQIDQAKAAGASIILLIVAALDQDTLQQLYTYAKHHDLDVLVEVHNETEMNRAQEMEADIIGINNRNLKTFDVDLQVTENLAPMVTSPNTLIIGESGVKTHTDVVRLGNAGVKGVLVGETLMRSNNLAKTFQDIQIPTRRTTENAR
ncbi:indole-3-glycerol phosphate synthase TrpC [Lentibacillus sp. N15]|uniref:indole-3-glycerol phosphate synthase TrpC n=1 Tax=Lentibacillus songyuanensis TaxID=3136161 RepID=UPI0031BB7DA6